MGKVKKITLKNGAVITRSKLEGYDEEWIIDNTSKYSLEITLDMKKCTGNVEVEGFEGESKATAT